VNDRKELPRRPPWRGQGTEGGHLESARTYIERLRSEPAEEAVPKLIEVLGDESWYLRERAGDALVGFGKVAAPAVESAAKGGLWFTRAAAMRVLGRIGAPSSLCLVLSFVEDRNQTIAEAAARALLDFCERDRALAVAKLLHGRGTSLRARVLDLLLRLDPDKAARLRRLVEASELMGPEGSLEPAEEVRIALEISDEEWSLDWGRLKAADPLPQPSHHLVHHLRGAEE
jgi:HEAT repeat protein